MREDFSVSLRDGPLRKHCLHSPQVLFKNTGGVSCFILQGLCYVNVSVVGCLVSTIAQNAVYYFLSIDGCFQFMLIVLRF